MQILLHFLKCLFTCLTNFKNLIAVSLSFDDQQSLPEIDFPNFPHLQKLCIDYADFPITFYHLCHLKKLVLEACPKITDISGLFELASLKLFSSETHLCALKNGLRDLKNLAYFFVDGLIMHPKIFQEFFCSHNFHTLPMTTEIIDSNLDCSLCKVPKVYSAIFHLKRKCFLI